MRCGPWQIRGRFQQVCGGIEWLGSVSMVGRLRAQHLDCAGLPIRLVVAAMEETGEATALAGVCALGV